MWGEKATDFVSRLGNGFWKKMNSNKGRERLPVVISGEWLSEANYVERIGNDDICY